MDLYPIHFPARLTQGVKRDQVQQRHCSFGHERDMRRVFESFISHKYLKIFKYSNISLRLFIVLTPIMTPPSQAYSYCDDSSFTNNDNNLLLHITLPPSPSCDDNNLFLHGTNPCILLMTSHHHLPPSSFAHRVFGVKRDICCGTTILEWLLE